MPVKSEQELQTLNVQNLPLKSNLFGNMLIQPFNGKTADSLLQKTKSLENGVHLAEINGTNGHYKSLIAIDSVKNERNGQLRKQVNNQLVINRYDSGYGSYVDFQSEETTFSECADTLIEEPDQLNDIESINANNQYVISEWQSYTSDGLSSFDVQSSRDTFSAPTSPSPQGSIKIPAQTIAPIPATTAKSNRNEYIRKVERFGTDLKDTCLFPLALPMDGSDVYKGKSDWQTITLLADCVLTKWLESSQKHYKKVNKALPNASKFMCPNLELESSVTQCPKAKLPLRRTNSELDFYKLGLFERKGVVHSKSRKTEVRDDIDINVSVEKGRFRAQTSLSIRRKSVQFVVAKRDKSEQRVTQKQRSNAKTLIESIRLENPISLALQITRIEKQLITDLPSDEVMSLVLKKGKTCDKSSHLNKLMQFSIELSNLISEIILKEVTNEAQGKKIAAIIEVGCVLRKLRNWQSLTSLIRGLQLPQIYSLSTAWSVTKAKYPIHFNDYLKLSQVVRNDSISILRSREPSIPSLTSFIALLRVRCLATWDRLDRAPRWTESPNLVQWIEHQMLNSIAIQESIANSNERMSIAMKKKQKKQKQIVTTIEKFRENKETHLDKCIKELSPEKRSFMPLNDPIYFIEDDHLPNSWTSRSSRNIPAVHQSKIIRCFKNSYKLELAHIENYKMN